MNAKITVDNIDYRKTLDSLYPVILKTFSDGKNNDFAVKLLTKIGEDAAKTILMSILDNVDDTEKKNIICGAINENAEGIEKHLNKALSEHDLSASVRGIYAFMENGRISVCADEIDADIKAIMASDTVSGAVTQKAEQFGIRLPKELTAGLSGVIGAAVQSTPASVKQKVIDTLSGGKNKEKLFAAVESAVSDWVCLKVTNVELELESRSKTGLPLLKFTEILSENSEGWQDRIIDAVAQFVRKAAQNDT